jgi:hypothetical protein
VEIDIQSDVFEALIEGDLAGAQRRAGEFTRAPAESDYHMDGIAVRAGPSWSQRFAEES